MPVLRRRILLGPSRRPLLSTPPAFVALATVVMGMALIPALTVQVAVTGLAILVLDFQAAPLRVVPVEHVSWFRDTRYDIKRTVVAPCMDETPPDASEWCRGQSVEWASDNHVAWGRGADREQPVLPGPACDENLLDGCTRVASRSERLSIHFQGPLGELRCYADERTWLHAARGGPILMRRSVLFGVLRCDGLSRVGG